MFVQVIGNLPSLFVLGAGHEWLFWFGFALSLLGVVFHIAYALLYCELLKPVNRRRSLFAMLVLLVATARYFAVEDDLSHGQTLQRLRNWWAILKAIAGQQAYIVRPVERHEANSIKFAFLGKRSIPGRRALS